jgi:beta-glucosidase
MDNPKALEKYGQLVKKPSDADIIVLRIGTPYGSPRGKSLIERFFQQGRLFFNEEELAEILGLIEQKPTVVVAHLARPSILTEINEKATALLAEFGTSDEIMTEVLFGKKAPQGKLPFELPSSQEAVENQLEDVPYDSENPLYEFGHGLSYE